MNTAKSDSNKSNRNDLYPYDYDRRPIMNFSDLVEDKTIHVSPQTSLSSNSLFEPIEMTGHSTSDGIDADALSVSEILGTSFVPEIRHMSEQGADQASLRISLPNKDALSVSSSARNFSWNRSVQLSRSYADSLNSECFQPAENMKSALVQDEKEWENEFAAIPVLDDSTQKKVSPKYSGAIKRNQGKLINLTEFSAYLGDSSSRSESDVSIGHYFSNRCEDLGNMIEPNTPTKAHHGPVALLTDSHHSGATSAYGGSRNHSQVSTIFTSDDEMRVCTLPRVNNATYDKKEPNQLRDSILSVSNIVAKLTDNDSPRAFLNKLVPMKRSKPLTVHNLKALNESSRYQSMAPAPSREMDKENQNMDTETREIGMLGRMNSTLIDEKEKEVEKENQWRRRNSSAETDCINGDVNNSAISFVSSYCSSITEAKENTSKRQRSETPPNVDSELALENLQLYSPKRDRFKVPIAPIRQCATAINSVEGFKPESVGAAQIRALDHSPNRGMNISLPINLQKSPNLRHPPYGQAMIPTRSSSQCSNNSEFTQNDGKFPLKANKSELTWECVKLRKSVTKSFVIKNSSEKKLTLKIEVVGPGFQIAASGADKEQLQLQGNECRTLSITFCPTILGKAIGEVTFKPMRNWPDGTARIIHLWGYGGNTNIQLQDVERAPVGNSFLKMGETNSIRSTTLVRTFSIFNKGPLNGVATIFIKQKSNQYINESHINIQPNKCVIRPDSSVEIKVTYKLRRKDWERLLQKSCDVLTVGNLEVIVGAEPNRQRIASMLTRSGSIPAKFMQLEFLVNNFPIANHESFTDFREHIDNVTELFNCFKSTDVALTINCNTLDESRDGYPDLSGIDDTVLFRTIVEKPDHGAAAVSTASTMPAKMLIAYPDRLIMDIRNPQKTITIQSNFTRPQTFQIDSNYRSYLNFSQTSGSIDPYQEILINVELKPGLRIMPCEGIITIYVEYDCVEIPISIRAAF